MLITNRCHGPPTAPLHWGDAGRAHVHRTGAILEPSEHERRELPSLLPTFADGSDLVTVGQSAASYQGEAGLGCSRTMLCSIIRCHPLAALSIPS